MAPDVLSQPNDDGQSAAITMSIEGAGTLRKGRGMRDAVRRASLIRLAIKDSGQLDFEATALAIVTLVLFVFGTLAIHQTWTYHAPTDGVDWQMGALPGGAPQLVAAELSWGSPAAEAGVRPGDVLLGIDGETVSTPEDVTRRCFAAGIHGSLTYTLRRGGQIKQATLQLAAAPAHRSLYVFQALVGFLYLFIGVFVFARRRSAHKALHFYFFCLASFLLYTFHYSDKLNVFDTVVYWGNVVATLLVPALFLHLALTYPQRKGVLRYLPGLLVLVYVLPAIQLAFRSAWAAGFIQVQLSPAGVLGALDRLDYLLLATYFVAAAVVFHHTYSHTGAPLLRQQLKWITAGTTAAVLPFIAFYIMPYLLGVDAPRWAGPAVVPLILIPLTFSYAIIRYRLMDVDIIFRRGVVYTLATAAIVVVYFALIGTAAILIHSRAPSSGQLGLVMAIVITAVLFQPVKNWIQERLDRLFYRERYDYRQTMAEFGRQMNAEPDLDRMLSLVVERLAQTLSVERLAIFLGHAPTDSVDDTASYALVRAQGLEWCEADSLDLGFLASAEFSHGRLFFENPHHAVTLPPRYRETAAALDLNYYIRCELKGRTVAVLGLGKTRDGAYLSSDDVELVETLAGYLAVAIDNAQLYASLQSKIAEYERLKDFNENIVESSRVGVIAVGLSGAVESWNSQMESISGLPRSRVIGHTLGTIFGGEFAASIEPARASGGIRNIYKFKLQGAESARTVNLAVAPLVTRELQKVGHLVLVDDITERLDLEQKLAQSERLSSVGLLAAGVAHEVNTPLAVISNYTQLLAKQLRDDDPRTALLQKITEQTFRASEIIGSLLHFSRTRGAELAEVNLNAVIRETLALVDHPLKTAGIQVTTTFAGELPAMLGNSGKLQQVFLNLVLNARDAMPSGGALHIQTVHDGATVMAAVTDTGVGMSSAVREKVFDPFFTTKSDQHAQQAQRLTGVPSPPSNGEDLKTPEARAAAEAAQTVWKSGTGLGLSVTYGIVQEHGGTIAVESHPGEGSCFTLHFPTAAARRAVSERGTQPMTPHSSAELGDALSGAGVGWSQ